MAQQVEAIANTLLELGRIKGQGAANQGQIWGNTLAGLGQIPQQIQHGRAREQDMQLRQQEMGLRGQELQIRQGQIAQQQRGQEDQQSLDAAMQAGILQRPDGSYAPDRQKISDYLVTNGKGHILPSLQKSWAESDEIQAKAQKAKREAADAEAEDIAAVATRGLTLLDHGASAEDAAGVVLPDVNVHGKNGIISPDAQRGIVTQLDAAKSDPVALRTLLEGWRNASKTQSAALKDRAEAGAAVANTANRAAELPGIQAKSAEAQQVASTMVGGRTAAQIEDDRRQAEAAAATQRNQEEARRLETQRIRLEGGRLKVEQDRERREGSTNTPLDLTPGGLDAAALNYAKTGQLPPLGMGDKVTRKQIINRAAEIAAGTGAPPRTDLDLASARASFAANEGSLKKLQQQRDAISAFEKTASKNIDTFLQTAGKVVDTGSPLANTAVRALSGKVLGSPDQAAYETARQVAINEVAKIVSNPNLSGALSDSARKEVEAFNPSSATLKQSVAVMRILKQDMANRASAMDDELSAIQSRISGKTPKPPVTAAPRDGQESTVNGHPAVWKVNGPQGPGWYAK